MIDLGLYVHLPFCRRRCTYCAFAISVERSLEAPYLDALIREVRASASSAPQPVETLFYGGGTPSLMGPANLQRLDRQIRAAFQVNPQAEFTLEANPEDVSAQSLEVWSGIGVNRLSLGVQSFIDEELYPLGRGHGRSAALEALDRAVARGGFRVSVDLILGLPGQTVRSFERSLVRAIEGGVGHLSLYMLDLEEGSALWRQVEVGRSILPEDDVIAAMYKRAIEVATEAGLEQYEVSNFARPGEESLHNLRYWERRPYLGLGLGAHSFAGQQRYANTRDLSEYLKLLGEGDTAVVFRETLTPEEEREEKIFLSLRQARGVRYSDLVRLCGPEGMKWVERGTEEGWLFRREDRVAFTPAGFLLSNDHIARLF
jgi:oxygen-independent coproporphyrinogen III oxidase